MLFRYYLYNICDVVILRNNYFYFLYLKDMWQIIYLCHLFSKRLSVEYYCTEKKQKQHGYEELSCHIPVQMDTIFTHL